MESTEQLYFMGGAASVLWAYLIARGVIAWQRHRHPRRATYTAPRSRRAVSVPITKG